MRYLGVLLLFTVFLSISACCSKKNKTIEVSKDEVITENEMIEAGYKKATIVYFAQKEAPCDYLIQVDDNTNLFEPQKELENDFKENNKPIWIKYQFQRRMSRCESAQPIGIISIEKRVE